MRRSATKAIAPTPFTDMSDNSNYPPGVTGTTIARANGELVTCHLCGREFVRRNEQDDFCSRCEHELDKENTE